MAIVYDSYEHTEKSEGVVMVAEKGRPNGSLHSRQKRSIADACEYLRVTQKPDSRALIFCLTSPGYTSLANTPKFISKFVDNMRTNYGMGNYVWVREMTKRGYPHFHFVAHWNNQQWFLRDSDDQTKEENHLNKTIYEARITGISKYWSNLFGSQATNSVRIGSYNPHTKRRTFYLSTERHAWYLTKYIGKGIGTGSLDYLCEAGFPFVVNEKQKLRSDGSEAWTMKRDVPKWGNYKSTVRAFGMSQDLAMMSEPTLFESRYVVTDTKEVEGATGEMLEFRNTERRWIHNDETDFRTGYKPLNDIDVNAYQWRWTGHGETFIGVKLKQKTK